MCCVNVCASNYFVLDLLQSPCGDPASRLGSLLLRRDLACYLFLLREYGSFSCQQGKLWVGSPEVRARDRGFNSVAVTCDSRLNLHYLCFSTRNNGLYAAWPIRERDWQFVTRGSPGVFLIIRATKCPQARMAKYSARTIFILAWITFDWVVSPGHTWRKSPGICQCAKTDFSSLD